MMSLAIPAVLLRGLRRHLAAPKAEIIAIQRHPFPGGLSGSRFERWRLDLRHVGPATSLTLIYKQGEVVAGAFLQGAPQREASTYAALARRIPLILPIVVATDATAGDIWMRPFPPAKPASHWQAAWDAGDVRAVIADLATLHAAFWNQTETPATYPWLLQPTLKDAARLVNAGRAGLERIQAQTLFDDSLTPERIARLLALARDPAPLRDALHAGPMTLLHGDAGFQNIAIAQDGGMRIWFDWQLTGWGPPALDWATFLHPWAYPEAHPPLSLRAMSDIYLKELARRGIAIPSDAFRRQLDAALLWRWIIQWAPLLGLHRERLRPDALTRLERAFDQLHWPALARVSPQPGS